MVVALFWKRLVGWLLYCPYWPLPPLKVPLPPRPRLGALVRLRSIGTVMFCIHRGAFDELYCRLLLNGGFLGGPRKLLKCYDTTGSSDNKALVRRLSDPRG